MTEMALPSIDPKNTPAKKDPPLLANWAQIHTQSPAVIIYRGPSNTLHFREKPQTEQPRLLYCTPAIWVDPY